MDKTDRRLRVPSQFAAVATARGPAHWRSARRWLSVSALIEVPATPRLRLGLVVSKKMARRALDRNAVRRIVREAVSRVRPELGPSFDARAIGVDLVFRLKAPAPKAAERSFQQWKVALNCEADALLTALSRELARRESAAPEH